MSARGTPRMAIASPWMGKSTACSAGVALVSRLLTTLVWLKRAAMRNTLASSSGRYCGRMGKMSASDQRC